MRSQSRNRGSVFIYLLVALLSVILFFVVAAIGLPIFYVTTTKQVMVPEYRHVSLDTPAEVYIDPAVIPAHLQPGIRKPRISLAILPVLILGLMLSAIIYAIHRNSRRRTINMDDGVQAIDRVVNQIGRMEERVENLETILLERRGR